MTKNSTRRTKRIDIEKICPFCNASISENMGDHIKKEHGEESYKLAVLKAKEKGIPDHRIGDLFNINFKRLESIITEAYGVNISMLKKPKKIRTWEPNDFKEETTSVWSFRRRGGWATHDGRYRGNWSPYIPRNVILRYSDVGETVLDYFVGGGTTAVESKLLGRRCIAGDINPAAISLTKDNLNFEVPKIIAEKHPIYEPQLSVGDARHLVSIEEGTIDLICAHPPYAGIISYGTKVEGDLSSLDYDDFINQMREVASESYRVLKRGRECVILIGDTRKKKHIIPIGFRTIDVFIDAGFRVKELIIKRQHNCKTTGFWYANSIKHNFLLLAHEYLVVFEKPALQVSIERGRVSADNLNISLAGKIPTVDKIDTVDTTSVWILPGEEEEEYEDYVCRNVVKRYSDFQNYLEARIEKIPHGQIDLGLDGAEQVKLIFIKSPCLNDNISASEAASYPNRVKSFIETNLNHVGMDGFLVIQTRDVRINGYLAPLAKKLIDTLVHDNLWLKEIIITTANSQTISAARRDGLSSDLHIAHQYLLVYEVHNSELSNKSNAI